MVVRLLRRLDLVHPVVDRGRPLIGLAADEPVELVEAGAGRPAIGRARSADLPGRGLVRLAEGGGGEAVEAKHLGQRCHAVGPLPGLPGEGGGGLRDRAHVAHVMVAAGKQRGTGRRAERRGVKLIVPEPVLGQRSAVGMWIGPPKALDWPNPMSSISTMSTLGRRPAPSPRIAAGPSHSGHRAR